MVVASGGCGEGRVGVEGLGRGGRLGIGLWGGRSASLNALRGG